MAQCKLQRHDFIVKKSSVQRTRCLFIVSQSDCVAKLPFSRGNCAMDSLIFNPKLYKYSPNSKLRVLTFREFILHRGSKYAEL